MTENQDFYRALTLIRYFEQTVLDNFPKGVFQGTTHTYLGQEANAVGVLSQLQKGDVVVSNHRCHGHYLACGGDVRALFAELMGRSTGVCGGRGGSQHLHWRNFYSNGVQGGILPIATGIALAEKQLNTGSIAFCFLGDGTLGQGVVYEAFNMASLWGAPVLFVLENNRIAQTTPVELALAGEMTSRFAAFGIPVLELDTADVLAIQEAAGELVDQVRKEHAPRGLILHTHRFGPHSKGDDTRSPKEIEALKREHDPLRIHTSRLSPAVLETIEGEVRSEVESAFQTALADPMPEIREENQTDGDLTAIDHLAWNVAQNPTDLDSPETVLQCINRSLLHMMENDSRIILLGQDVLDPYGGAFKVTRGLSSTFPNRVIPTPISEAGIVGVASGMALRGLRPVVEIMFGDFLTLAADQVINHIAKFRWMYNDQVRVPLVIRTPMGGRRAYGPTHSQTLEKIYLGIPGLKVLAPCTLGNPGDLLSAAIQDEDPVLFVEHKLLYSRSLQDGDSLPDYEIVEFRQPGTYPAYMLRIKGVPKAHITMVSYGYMAELAVQSALRLAYEDEIFVELVVLTQLSPFVLDPVVDSVRDTRRIITIEEGTLSLGWGAEVIARVSGELGQGLLKANRVAAQDLPVPASTVLEEFVLPDVKDIITTAKAIVSESR
jgi:2-oxoisovalerate dehydrogenase E1 component